MHSFMQNCRQTAQENLAVWQLQSLQHADRGGSTEILLCNADGFESGRHRASICADQGAGEVNTQASRGVFPARGH